ncbi:ABC transporter permease OS=Streptomyces microflavus OX=1919 GN=Smic_25050 PE=4 SV=1 [Streptomyces microflavus]
MTTLTLPADAGRRQDSGHAPWLMSGSSSAACAPRCGRPPRPPYCPSWARVFVAATGSLQPDDTVLGGSLTLSVVAQMLAAVVGALVLGEQQRHHPDDLRSRPAPVHGVRGQGGPVAGVMYVLALLSCSTAYLVGNAMLPEGRYAQGDPLPALFGIAASFAVAAVLGLAVGTLVRHSWQARSPR